MPGYPQRQSSTPLRLVRSDFSEAFNPVHRRCICPSYSLTILISQQLGWPLEKRSLSYNIIGFFGSVGNYWKTLTAHFRSNQNCAIFLAAMSRGVYNICICVKPQLFVERTFLPKETTFTMQNNDAYAASIDLDMVNWLIRSGGLLGCWIVYSLEPTISIM